MQLLVAACMISVAVAARLENTYLPPSSAFGAGGSGNFLGTPFRPSSASRFGGSAFGSAFGSASSAFKTAGSFPGAPAPAPAPTSVYAPAPISHQSYSSGPQINILRYNNDNDGLGSYSFAYETQNHISAQESGQLKNAGTPNEASSAHGSFSYTSPDGTPIALEYIADENGFQPSGAHLPTPPPIPEAILKSLQYNAANPSSDDSGLGNGQFQSPAFSKQYLAPNNPSFNPQSGYRY